MNLYALQQNAKSLCRKDNGRDEFDSHSSVEIELEECNYENTEMKMVEIENIRYLNGDL